MKTSISPEQKNLLSRTQMELNAKVQELVGLDYLDPQVQEKLRKEMHQRLVRDNDLEFLKYILLFSKINDTLIENYAKEGDCFSEEYIKVLTTHKIKRNTYQELLQNILSVAVNEVLSQ